VLFRSKSKSKKPKAPEHEPEVEAGDEVLYSFDPNASLEGAKLEREEAEGRLAEGEAADQIEQWRDEYRDQRGSGLT